jgi:hypothetical protein
MRRVVFIIAINILLSVVLVATVELTVRILGFGPRTPPHWDNQFGKHKILGYTAVPYSRWSFVAAYDGVLKTNIGTANKHGFRPTIVNKDCERCPVILALGDSNTFSAEVNDDETWPEFTAHTLNKRGKAYKLVNYGMRGYSTVQSYLAMKEAFQHVDDIEAVIYMFSTNDPYENFLIRLSHILERPRPFIMLDKDRAFTLHEPVITQEWERAFKNNASQGGLLKNIIRYNLSLLSAYDYVVKGVDHKEPSKQFDLSDDAYLLQWNDGQAVRNIGMLEKSLRNQYYLATLGELLSDMNKECRERGIKFYVASLPTFIRPGSAGEELTRLIQIPAVQFDKWKRMIDQMYDMVETIMMSTGGNVLDLDRNLMAEMSFREYASSPDDWHYSAHANKKIGDEMAEKLIQQWRDDPQRGITQR